jgi:hypothetical protein
MKSETAIRDRLERIETDLEHSTGHDQSHLIGQRNILEWVLEDESGGSSSEHWSGQTGGQR